MVQDPGAESGHHRLRPLNTPQAVHVEQDVAGRPVSVTLYSRRLEVIQVLDTWRIDEEWWREQPVSRFYWLVALDDGRPLTIFFDLIERRWWRQSY
jgi:hypothetical protein